MSLVEALFKKTQQVGQGVFKRVLNGILPPRCILCRTQVPQDVDLCLQCWPRISQITGPCCSRCGMPFSVYESDSVYEIALEDSKIEKGSVKADPLDLEYCQKYRDVEGVQEIVDFSNSKPCLNECARCLRDPPSFQEARSTLYYDEASKELILKYKHGDMLALARVFSKWMSDARFLDFYKGVDIVMPVPLHPRRLMKRKYNQSAFLAKNIARNFGKTYAPMLVVRSKNTSSQGHKSKSERYKNVQSAFKVQPKNLPEINKKVIMIIDDVYTSGATACEISRCLVAAGAAEVRVHTLARVCDT